MSIFIYIFLFFMINRIMFVSPMLGMILYIGFIAYIFTSNRRRMRMFQQRQQQAYSQQYQQQNQQNHEQNTYRNTQNNTNEKSIKDAIDVEFSEEEL